MRGLRRAAMVGGDRPDLRKAVALLEIGDRPAVRAPVGRDDLRVARPDGGQIAQAEERPDEFAAAVQFAGRAPSIEGDDNQALAIAISVGIGAADDKGQLPAVGRGTEWTGGIIGVRSADIRNRYQIPRGDRPRCRGRSRRCLVECCARVGRGRGGGCSSREQERQKGACDHHQLREIVIATKRPMGEKLVES